MRKKSKRPNYEVKKLKNGDIEFNNDKKLLYKKQQEVNGYLIYPKNRNLTLKERFDSRLLYWAIYAEHYD